MSKEPQISVIVPVYNVEKYLHRCINSILAQTFTDFELLLIDDGSKDNSGKICDEYAEKDKRIRVFHKENGGVASARQLGIEEARGEYSIHADGDDWVEPLMLEEMYNTIMQDKSDMLIADYFVDKDGTSTYIKQSIDSKDSLEILKAILKGELMGSLWHKLIRHSLYKEYNANFIRGIDYCEDVLLLTQLLIRNIKVSFLHQSFYHYDMSNINSITRCYSKNTYELRKKFVLTLNYLLSDSFEKEIKEAAFEVKIEAFIHGLLNKDDFYVFFPTPLTLILKKKYGKKAKLCMLFAYLGLFNVSMFLNKL